MPPSLVITRPALVILAQRRSMVSDEMGRVNERGEQGFHDIGLYEFEQRVKPAAKL